MLTFIINNLGTILVGVIVAGIIAAIVVKLIRDRRKGGCIGCDCDCENCNLKKNKNG